jgi:hypothetical protein
MTDLESRLRRLRPRKAPAEVWERALSGPIPVVRARRDSLVSLAAAAALLGVLAWCLVPRSAPEGPPGSPPVTRREAPETREQLRESFTYAGYVRIDDVWHRPVPWGIAVKSLHDGIADETSATPSFKDPQIQATWKRVELIKRPEGQTPLQVFTDNARQNPNRETREWFVGPRAGQASSGTLLLQVTAPGPIVECKVKLAGFVIAGVEGQMEGKVEVTVQAEGGPANVLYSIDRSSHTDVHDVTSLVKGRKAFTLSASMETALDKFGTYARVLQSLPDTRDPVFAVQGTVLKPDPDADRRWNEASDK